MPDLSRRSARYVTATVVAALLGVSAWNHVDIQVGSTEALARTQAENDALKKQLQEARKKPQQDARMLRTPQKPHEPTLSSAQVARKTCAAYPTQQAAQAVFIADSSRHPDWDGDRDGLACEQLKNAITPETMRTTATRLVRVLAAEPKAPRAPAGGPFVSKPTAPSKTQILASRRHFGLHTATTAEAASLEGSLARETTINSYFSGFDSGFSAAQVNAAWHARQIPMLTWESRPLNGDGSTADYSLASIAAGAHDTYLRKYAADIKANGLPLIIRFDQEMNGDWYRWGESNPAAGNAEGSYVAAWRHIHDVFAAEGANAQVIWLWGPNRVDNIQRLPAIGNYFPGAAYVDWVGMSGYYRPGDASATFDSTYAMTLNALRATAPGKPILLAEVGATERGGKKVAFVKDFFTGLTRNPDVKGFVWFNRTVTDEGQTNDWRIQSTTAVLDAFRAGLYSARFGLDLGKRPTW